MNNRQEQIEQARRLIATGISEDLVEILHQQFPELQDSDDERIRNEIIAFVEQAIHRGGGTPIPKEKEDKWIAYLEKQKEQKPAAGEEKFESIDNAFRTGREIGFHEGVESVKPAEWSEDIIRKAVKEVGLTQHQIDWFKTNVFPPKQEWGEEDEEHLDSIIESYKELLKDYFANHGVDYIPYNTPVVARTVLNDINFLKSLRPQPHWKPSEEQMKALNEVANDGVLLDLFNDLLKLL